MAAERGAVGCEHEPIAVSSPDGIIPDRDRRASYTPRVHGQGWRRVPSVLYPPPSQEAKVAPMRPPVGGLAGRGLRGRGAVGHPCGRCRARRLGQRTARSSRGRRLRARSVNGVARSTSCGDRCTCVTAAFERTGTHRTVGRETPKSRARASPTSMPKRRRNARCGLVRARQRFSRRRSPFPLDSRLFPSCSPHAMPPMNATRGVGRPSPTTGPARRGVRARRPRSSALATGGTALVRS